MSREKLQLMLAIVSTYQQMSAFPGYRSEHKCESHSTTWVSERSGVRCVHVCGDHTTQKWRSHFKTRISFGKNKIMLMDPKTKIYCAGKDQQQFNQLTNMKF
jgi:hypothetical protein